MVVCNADTAHRLLSHDTHVCLVSIMEHQELDSQERDRFRRDGSSSSYVNKKTRKEEERRNLDTVGYVKVLHRSKHVPSSINVDVLISGRSSSTK